MVSCSDYLSSESLWAFCPSLFPSYLFLVLFALVTVAHLVQAIKYRAPYCWVITMSAFWQTFTYAFHTVSLYYPDSFNYYAIWFVVMLVAPLWTNAFVYMVFGRMVWSYRSDGKIWKIKAWQFGLLFVILDIVAFLVQVYGAGQASGSNNQSKSKTLSALHIYMYGLGIQMFFIFVFTFFAVYLFFQMRRSNFNVAGKNEKRPTMLLFFVMFAALALIVLRIVFRLIEYSSGLTSTIPRHEAFQYSLDSTPMFLALLLFNIVHPGKVLGGRESDMPHFWQRNKPSYKTESSDISMYSNLVGGRPST